MFPGQDAVAVDLAVIDYDDAQAIVDAMQFDLLATSRNDAAFEQLLTSTMREQATGEATDDEGAQR